MECVSACNRIDSISDSNTNFASHSESVAFLDANTRSLANLAYALDGFIPKQTAIIIIHNFDLHRYLFHARNHMAKPILSVGRYWANCFYLVYNRNFNQPDIQFICANGGQYVGWTWGTLSVLNLSGPIQTLLDSAAISLGETRISIWLIIQAFLTLVILFVGARFVSTTGADRIRKNKDISPSLQVLIIKFTQVVLYSAVFIIGLRTVGFDLTGLAFLSGAIGVGLGFGLQKVVSNLVSGVIILLDKSIKPGDVISLGDTFGWIESLGARYVSVVTRDGREYLIPNEDLITGQVVNWSHSNNFV